MLKMAKWVVLAAIGLIVIAGCSSDSDDSASVPASSTTIDPAGDGGADETPSTLDVAADGAQIGTIESLEAAWAESRASMVAELTEGGFGVDEDGLLTGPGDLRVDLSACPASWSDRAGSSQIELALIADPSVYGGLAEGIEAYFEYVNETGGINGRRLNLSVINDQSTSASTIEAVDNLVAEGAPLAVTTFGTPSTLSVFDQLNRECLPQPFVGSAHPAWGDAQGHPWTMGMQLSYSTEATIWGNWISRNLSSQLPVRVTALVIDNDFGRAYQAAFARWAEANRDVVAEFTTVPHEPDAPTVDEALAAVIESEPQVFLAMTAGRGCELVVAASDSSGLNQAAPTRFIPSVCADPGRYFEPFERAGDGYLMVDGGFRSINDPRYQDDAFVSFVNTALAEGGLDPQQGFIGVGAAQYGWAHVEALRVAADLEGGVTRSNLLLAMRSLELRHPLLVPGVSFSTDGVRDSFAVEGSRVNRYSAGLQAWEPDGLVVDLNGVTPNCSWDGERC